MVQLVGAETEAEGAYCVVRDRCRMSKATTQMSRYDKILFSI